MTLITKLSFFLYFNNGRYIRSYFHPSKDQRIKKHFSEIYHPNSDIDEFEYKYIEEEMMADFCAEMETEIYMKEKRKITIEERIQIYNIARLKIKSIVKR